MCASLFWAGAWCASLRRVFAGRGRCLLRRRRRMIHCLLCFFIFLCFAFFFVVVLPFVAFLFMPTAPFATRWQNANFVFLWWRCYATCGLGGDVVGWGTDNVPVDATQLTALRSNHRGHGTQHVMKMLRHMWVGWGWGGVGALINSCWCYATHRSTQQPQGTRYATCAEDATPHVGWVGMGWGGALITFLLMLRNLQLYATTAGDKVRNMWWRCYATCGLGGGGVAHW